ncbi:phosphate ABC transporter permease PstA [Gulosibacter molinativorax]|uniref:Phosphate transport system permease protein PstA n=1 Tax=Gulosibacter molinativorax TaxID=256821 RepID=A0ABT7C410_9MICO|nr:phosphate ABC transporter permease PstA [Gulosibacter molinativorax]MDJ1369969.1 phosphate ABC transporter permease PtsA [Gulosibacter molinativorax]QUY63841.1 Phosphate transport system permease protein PstA [Gulosibacter molinativorax]
MTTTTQTSSQTAKRTDSALTAGQLQPWHGPAILIASFAVSFVLFLIIWLSTGEPFLTVVERSGKVTINFNWGGWLALGAVLYLIAIWSISRAVEGPRQATNRLVTGGVTTAFVLAMIPLLSLLFTLVVNGWEGVTSANFFTNDAATPGQRGALHAIVGTLLITLATSIIAVPIGIFTAIYLVEYGNGNWLSKAINFFVDVMTGIPSIVAGLFAFALFMMVTQATGGDTTRVNSGFAGAIALLVLMIPTVVRSAEEMLRLVPMDLREASYALGVTKWRTIAKIVLPTALAGLVTGVLLAIARVIGETAPLMVAAGMTINMNANLFSGQMSALPTFVYQQWKFGTAEGEMLAWGGALMLLIIVILFNVVGRLVSHFFSPKGDR